MNYITQVSCKNLIFGLFTFVFDNSLQTTRHAVQQMFAVFSCNLLLLYVFYCYFQIFSTCGMLICHFVLQYYLQTLNWIEICAVTKPIQRFVIFLLNPALLPLVQYDLGLFDELNISNAELTS